MITDVLRRGVVLPALVTVMGLTASAPAQFGEAAGFGEMMSPYFLRRDLEILADGLDLDEGQAVIVEQIYFDYEDEHEAGKARMLDRLSNMREDLDGLDRSEILRLVFQPFEDRSSEWDSLRLRFLENIKAILSDEQLESWPGFEQKLRREKELPKGRFSGESVNLFHMVRDLDLDEQTYALLESLLEEYALALDEVLRWRETELRDARMAMMHAIRDEDPESSLAIYERQIKARAAIRDINDQFTELVVDRLPVGVSEEFQRLVRERAYPRIYRRTAAQRIFKHAKELEDLTEETLAAIVDLEAAYLSELGDVNRVLVRLLREYEPKEALFRAQSFAMRAVGKRADRPADPTREEFRRRDEIGKRYIESLRDLLTPEQFASIPGAQRFLPRAARGSGEDGAKGSLSAERAKKIKSLQRPPGSIGNTRGGLRGGDN